MVLTTGGGPSSKLAQEYYAAALKVVQCSHAAHCNRKFGRYHETPQVRPLGNYYLPYRLAVISENPGGKPDMAYEPDAKLMKKYRGFAEAPSFDAWLELNQWLLDEALQNFGKGKYIGFLNDLGVAKTDDCAHLVTAYCRTCEEKAKARLLSYCFSRIVTKIVLPVLKPAYVITVGKYAYEAVKLWAARQDSHLAVSLHWAQKSDANRKRLMKRCKAIRRNTKRYRKHVHKGGSPESFESDKELGRWPDEPDDCDDIDMEEL